MNSLKGRALIYTDGARSWATRRLDMLGVDLPILSRDDQTARFERKAGSTTRLAFALDELRSSTNEDLRPEEVLMFDDSTSVLRFMKSQALKTAFCHYGTPGRTGCGGFDYEVHQVGKFLEAQGFVPKMPSTFRQSIGEAKLAR